MAGMAKFDISGIARMAKRVADTAREADKAVSRATATLRRRLPVEARRDIQEEYNLPAGRIRRGLTSRTIDGGVELTGSARGVGAIEFGGRWRGRKSDGATYMIRHGGDNSPLPGSFIATLLNGNRQIVERKGPKQRMTKGVNKGRMKQPLQVVYGPSVAQMLRRPARGEHLADYAQTILSAEIERLLR